MSRKSSIRAILGQDPKANLPRPPMHKSSYSLSAFNKLGRSALDSSFLSSSTLEVSEDSELPAPRSRLPDSLPLITRSKASLTDTDTGLRPVVLKRRPQDFHRSLKDSCLSFTISKSKRPFAGLMPLGALRRLEESLPIKRWPNPAPIGITILPAAPDSEKPQPSPTASAVHLHSITGSLPQPVRRQSKLRDAGKLLQSFDQSMPGSPDSSFDLSYRGTPISQVLEEEIDTKGAYPYLASLSRKPRPSKLLQSPLLTPQRKEQKTGRTSCTCSLKLYLTASLHYQQLFLRVPPSGASIQHFPSLVKLMQSTPEWEDRALVLIVVFEGVLGDWGKDCLMSRSPFFLKVRSEAVAGLAQLQQAFRLVLVSSMPKKACLHALTYFRNRNVFFEAAYRVNNHHDSSYCRASQFISYSKVEKDLSLTPRRMLVLTGLNLSQDELEAPSAELLYSRCGTKIFLNANYVPVAVPASEGVPVMCLVPSLRAQDSGVLTFVQIAKALLAFGDQCAGDWVSGFYAETESPGLFLFSTSAVHQALMATVLPEPRADSFLCQILPSHTCSLHNRLAWGMGPSIHPFTSKVMYITASAQDASGPGFDIIESRSQQLTSGYMNLLDYVLSSGPKACLQ